MDSIEIVSTVFTGIALVISLVFNVLLFLQNQKINFDVNRAVLYFEIKKVNNIYFFVLGNNGKSHAIIDNISFSKDISELLFDRSCNPFTYLNSNTLCSNKKIVCGFDHKNIVDKSFELKISINYTTLTKKKEETYIINFGSIFNCATAKPSVTINTAQVEIAKALQDILLGGFING